jgi:hypothetical protein
MGGAAPICALASPVAAPITKIAITDLRRVFMVPLRPSGGTPCLCSSEVASNPKVSILCQTHNESEML